MKNAPLVVAARDADDAHLRVEPSVPFRISELHDVAYGSKVAEFRIVTPLGTIDADLFRPSGREPFVQSRSIRDKFTGQWRRTVTLDARFAARVLDALQTPAQTARNEQPAPTAIAPHPSSVLLQSERRFEKAFAELRSGEARVQ